MSLNRNLVLAARNRIEEATLTGGAWTALENLKTFFLGQTASSTTLDAEQTWIEASWPTSQVVDLVAICGHNLTVDGQVRLRLWLGDQQVYDSGTVNIWPAWPFGTIPFGDPRWWGHQMIAEDIEGYHGYWLAVMPELTVVDRLRLDVLNPLNPRGFIDLPLIFAGPALQVSANYDPSDGWGWQESGDVDLAEFGTPITGDDEDPRVFRCQLSHLPHDEALAGLGELMRYCGRGRRPVLVVPDPGDLYHLHRRSFLGFFPRRPLLETAYKRHRRAALEIWEWRA
jgi:hypothetical protein